MIFECGLTLLTRITLSNIFANSETTYCGSSFWMKCPQPFAIRGPLLRSFSVIFARPLLYVLHMGFKYFVVIETGVPSFWGHLLHSWGNCTGNYLLPSSPGRKFQSRGLLPSPMALYAALEALGCHSRAKVWLGSSYPGLPC